MVGGEYTMIQFSFCTEEEILEVKLNGDLDIDSTEIVDEELIPMLNGHQSVKLNMIDVPFVDSSGMGLLMHLVQTLTDKGTTVTILNVRDEVMEVFELLQIPEILGKGVFA
jgi:anti-anti-sigma factor